MRYHPLARVTIKGAIAKFTELCAHPIARLKRHSADMNGNGDEWVIVE
jgi:hypothetical protein